jgi:hypothetical protein
MRRQTLLVLVVPPTPSGGTQWHDSVEPVMHVGDEAVHLTGSRGNPGNAHAVRVGQCLKATGGKNLGMPRQSSPGDGPVCGYPREAAAFVILELEFTEAPVGGAAREQLGMGAGIKDFSALHHDDAIGLEDG